MAKKSLLKPVKTPYIKVQLLEDDDINGNKGDVIPIAYKAWSLVPADIKHKYKLVEGPDTLQDLKELQLKLAGKQATQAQKDVEQDKEDFEVRKKRTKKR